MDEDSIKERQENEFEVLQSMFMDDLKDLRKNNAWKFWSACLKRAVGSKHTLLEITCVPPFRILYSILEFWYPLCDEWLPFHQQSILMVRHRYFSQTQRELAAYIVWRPLDLIITLKPQQSMTVHKEINVQVDLHVHCTPNYPNEIPKFEFKNTRGLSTQNLSDLRKQLLQIAERLKGEVMIYELAQHVQNFLHQHNKPQFKSFYEEMLHNQKCFEEREAKELKKQEEIRKLREHQAIQEEIHRKQEALKKISRRRKDSQRQINSSDESDEEDNAHNQDKHEDDKIGFAVTEKQFSSTQDRFQHMKKGINGKLGNNEEHSQGELDSDHALLCLFTREISDCSRILKEFEILQWLGSGGFGDVLKAKNKLDGRIYAVKRIHLNPSNKQLNRKIMREVKLLSSLNHENVVRYYHSWVETTTEALKEEEDSSDTAVCDTDSSKSIKGIINFYNSVEKLAPPLVEGSVEWSVSYDCNARMQDADDESSDDDDVFGMSILHFSDSSNDILFEENKEENSRKENDHSSTQASENQSEKGTELRSFQFMYIQMEFCERSTLRSAIDENLCSESHRLWRLFREIIEGLCHIHQQGMIHRDLKPVNIFLDSNDHVKIGDFGLATTDILPKTLSLEYDGRNVDHNEHLSFEINETHSSTGAVGTALYVAPELMTISSSKGPYNQKVDLYSLGIIFFEMCYPKLKTGMERVNVLANLRLPDICFPPDVHEYLSSQQIYLVRWLLQHDVAKRPTSYELLASDYMPPPQMEETELNEMLRHIVSNPQSKAYKRMVSTLFKQETTVAADVTYDMDMQKAAPLSQFTHAFSSTIQSLEKIMQKHGAMLMSVPTLMPKSSIYKANDWCVHVMDHSGGIVMLPHDLRVPFARFVARREITNLKRYTLGKVYRERKVFGFHPRELYECAFDIVTSNPASFLPDSEVLKVVSEIIAEVPALQSRAYTIHLNHASLLKAVLLHCGIPEEEFHAVYNVLSDVKKEDMNRSLLQNKLTSVGLTDQSVASLCHYAEIQEPIAKIESLLLSITKRKNTPAASLAKQGLHELKSIITNCQALGVKNSILITPGLVYSINIFSGMMFHFTSELKKKHQKRCVEVLAAGGRYDKLIASFSSTSGTREINQSAVGVSIAVEKIVAAVAENNEFQNPDWIDVLVCSTGNKSMVKEKCAILQELWSCGIRANVTYDTSQSLEDIIEFCQEHRISYIVMLKDTECGISRVRILEKERFFEKKIPLTELIEFIQKLMSNKGEQNENQKFEISRSSSYCENLYSSGPSINITFLPKEKINNRKRCEIQIMSQLSTVQQCVSSRTKIEVLGVELPATVIKTVVANLELENENAFENSTSAIIEKHPREGTLLTRLMDQIHEQKFEKKCPVLVLYSLTDFFYKIIM